VHNLPSSESYIDQHPNALRLTLIEGDLDLTQFNVFATERVELAGIRIEARIIGASHVISFSTESFTLHEVFACVGLRNVSSWSLDKLIASPVERLFPGKKYGFFVRSIPWRDPEPQELLELTWEAAEQKSQTSFGLTQEFPASELSVTPKTVIVGHADDDHGRIVLATAHSYPNSRALVMSRTVLTHNHA
jgi:hypothetical protein